MINTLNIKQQQLSTGYFKTGSGNEKMLIMGSCRVAPYLNYLNQWNNENGNRFTIYSIDPFNWNWNEKDERVDYLRALKDLETHEGLLTMLRSIDIFIHEWYQNAGMFNCDKTAQTGIYNFGINPEIDICIPNWNDVFYLFSDIVNFDPEIRKKALQDFNVIGKLSIQLQKEIADIGHKNLQKFYEVCDKSDLPEMKFIFADQYKWSRFWHTYNHVSKHFTLNVFYLINMYLNLNLTVEFLTRISKHDMFADSYTPVTIYDRLHYGLSWDEAISELNIK